MKLRLFLTGSLMLSAASFNAGFSQTNTELFGQNRVQFRTFDWKYYQSESVKIYFYDRAGVELSRYIAEQMEKDLAVISKKMGNILPNSFDVVLYNCYDDYQQTNIGLASNNNIHNNTAGQVNIIGNKIIVYFTGEHVDIKRQLRAGITSIILEKTLFGESMGEALRNSLLLNHPKWFTEGYLNYVLDGWDSKDNSKWKTLIQNEKESKRFEELARRYPALAGKAFWKYLIERYGEKNVRDFIFISQNETNLSTASKSLTGYKIVKTFDSLVAYYQNVYTEDDKNQFDINNVNPLIQIKNDDPDTRISRIKVSPRGVDVAYVASKNGLFDVILQKSEKVNGLDQNRKAKIITSGYINHNEPLDPDYPILAWSNTGYKLGIIYKKYNMISIKVYDAVKAKVFTYFIKNRKFDRILSFTFMEDDDKIVFSAIKNGQSDIFEYRLKRGQITQITDDPYDDLEPVFVSGGSRKGILFLSNRPEPYINIKPLPNELPVGKMKGYFFNHTTKSYELLSLTADAKGDVFDLIAYGQDNFAYLTNENGVVNRNVVAFKRNEYNRDVPFSIPATNFNYGILTQQYNPASKSIADVVATNKGIDVFYQKVELPEPFGNLKPVQRTQALLSEETFLNNSKKDNLMQEIEESKSSSKRRSILQEGNGNFQSKYSGSENETSSIADKTTIDSFKTVSTQHKILYVDSTFIRLRSQQYRRAFKPDFYSVRIDNNQLFTRYQNYTGFISTPSLGGMLSASLFDKMEDYRFTGGYRLPLFSNGSAYFLQFDNFKRRIDWGLTYYRETKKVRMPLIVNTASGQIINEYIMKPVVNIIQGNVSYPLDKTKSVRANLAFRQDRTVLKAQDIISDYIGNEDKYFITSRVEFVHDDTKMRLYNIPEGLRMKLYGEYLYKLHDDNIYATSDAPRNNSGGFYNLGFDIRYYTPIYKNVTVALRTAFGHSGGSERIMYVIGGVDNALNAKIDNYPTGSLSYAFQSLTTSLRGYNQNARNGNTFGLVNAELRVPVMETFFRKPKQSAILKNLQAVAFVDAGSAWEGLAPIYDRSDSRVGVFTAPGNPATPGKVQVRVPYPGDENLCIGYGAGLRTMLYGYFFRADAAMNINNDFMIHLSMGVDF